MRIFPMIVLGCAFMSFARSDDKKPDLQGTWVVESVTRDGKADDALKGGMRIHEGAKYVVRPAEGSKAPAVSGMFLADVGKSPVTLDMKPETGRYKGQTLLGIAKVAGDTLSPLRERSRFPLRMTPPIWAADSAHGASGPHSSQCRAQRPHPFAHGERGQVGRHNGRHVADGGASIPAAAADERKPEQGGFRNRGERLRDEQVGPSLREQSWQHQPDHRVRAGGQPDPGEQPRTGAVPPGQPDPEHGRFDGHRQQVARRH